MLQISIVLLTWALIIPQSLLFQFRGVVLSITDPRIRATSTYTLFLQRTVDNSGTSTTWDQVLINTSDSVVFTFPIEYSTGTANYVCASLMVNDAIVRNYSCLKSGNQITIRNFITAPNYIKSVTLTVNNVINPSPGGATSNFLATIGNDIAIPSFYSVANLISNSFTSCLASFSSTVYGNTTGQLRITTSSPSQISNTGYMLVSFPFYWQRDVSRQVIRFSVNQACQAAQGFAVGCTGGYNGTGYPQLQVTGIFLDGGFTSDFSISNVLSPITNQPIDMITIQSFEAGGKPVDRCDVYPTGILQRPITNIVVTPQQLPYPSSLIALTLSIRLPDLLVATDTIIFDFTSSYYPSFAYQSASASFFITWSQVLGNSLNMTFNRSLSTEQTLTITIFNVIVPPSLAIYDQYSVSVQSYGYSKMKGNFGLSAIAGVITNISVSIANLAAGMLSQYTINFTNPGPLPSTGAIRVYFPDIIYLPLNATILCQSIQVTVQHLANTNCLQLSSLPSVIVNPITLTFTNLVNPSTTSPILLPLQIRTYRSAVLHDDIASGTTTPSLYTFQSRSTLSCTVSSSSNITYAVSTLIFNISHRLPLPSDCVINITYYNIDVSVMRGTSGDIACFMNNVSQMCATDNNNSKIVVHVNQTQANSTYILVSISDYFINTRSTKVISYFMVQTYTAQGYRLQYMVLPVYLTNVVQPAPLDYFLLYSRSSLQNSALSSYTFAVKQSQPLYNFNNATSNTVVLKFPTTISLQSASCQQCSINITASTITFPVTSSFALLTIDNVGNTYSIEPVNSLSATFYMDSLYIYSQSVMLDNYITNIQSSLLSINTVYGSRIYGASTNVNVNIYAIHAQTAIIQISWAPEFIISGSSITVTGATLLSYNIVNSTTTITVSTPISTPNISLSFSNILLPYAAQSLPTIVTTFTSSNYLIGEGYLSTWTAACAMPCLTCTSVPSQCMSCFSNTSVTFYTLYDAVNKVCRVQCMDTQIQINNTCIICASTCYTCSISPSNCTSCPPSLYLFQYTCIPTCPTQYYKSLPSRTCQLCQSPCLTCVSLIQCITCRNGWYYMNGQCIIACPIQIYILDAINRVCLPCDPSCLACANTTSNCTSCALNFAMQNGVCVSQCSNNMYIYNFICVASCVTPCLTCLTFADYCLTCQASTPYLYNHTCVAACPSMYYISNTTSIQSCQPCSQLSIHCTYCLSYDTCSLCDTGYVLFQSQCLNYTPAGYANITGIALLCDNACITCTNLQNNCTSCRYDYYHNGICVALCSDSHYGYNHICYRCVSPCNQCVNMTTCLSCLPSSNKYYIASNMTCSSVCPIYYYANSSTSTCQPCISPCLTCISSTLCTSCISTTYLYNQRCLSQCPSQYYPNTTTSTCSPCISPCLTCLTSIQCLTCLPSFLYLYPNQCVSVCPTNYIINYIYGICANCTSPCLVCNQTYCFKCQATKVMYLGNCVTDCPTNMYDQHNNDTTRECTLCPTQCKTCTNNTMCIQCALGYFWLNGSVYGQCVQICPSIRPILSVHGCQPCQYQYCTSCYPNNECYQCINTTILFNGFCYIQCPTGYEYNSSIDSCSLIPPVPDNTTTDNSTVPNTSQVNASIVLKLPLPMIFTIAGGGLTVIFIVLSCCAKIGWPFALLVAAWGLPEIGSIALAGYAYHLYYIGIFTIKPIYGYVMVAALVLYVFINIVVFWYAICGVLMLDYKYKHWRKSASCLQILFLSFVLTLSLINFKMQNLLYFGLRSTPKLQSTSKLRYMAIASALSLISSVTFITIFILLIYEAKVLMLIWLDAIVCIFVSAIFSMLALKRDKTMFEQPQQQGIILHRRHLSSDQFLTAPMRPTQRQQNYHPLSDSKSGRDSSRGDSDSQASSRMQFRPSSRSFVYINSSQNNSLGGESMMSGRQQQQQLQSHYNMRSRNQISLQCSILSSGNNNNNSNNTGQPKQYYIQCSYQQGSQFANMGSIEQSKQWDGQVHQVQHYKEQYSLNKGVVLDQQGHRVYSWDVDSNEAVQEQYIGGNNYKSNGDDEHSQVDVTHVLGQLQQEQQSKQFHINANKQIKQQLQNHNESIISYPKSKVSISPLLINTSRVNKNTSLQWASIGQLQSSNLNQYNQLQQRQQQAKVDDNLAKRSQQKYKQLLMQRLSKNQSRNSNRSYQQDKIVKNDSRMSVQNKSRAASKILNNSIIQNMHDQNKSEMKQQPVIADRFDNSIINAQQGSLLNSQQAEQEYNASQNSVHNGSIDQLQQNNQNEVYNQSLNKNENNNQKQSDSISESQDTHNQQNSKQMKVEQNYNLVEDQNERWQFLLHQKSVVLDKSIRKSKSKSSSRVLSAQQQKIQQQRSRDSNNLHQSSVNKQQKQQQEYSQHYEQQHDQQQQDDQNSQNEDNELQQINETSKDHTNASHLINEDDVNQNGNNDDEQTGRHNQQQQEDINEQGEQNKNESKQMSYLQSKNSARRQAKPDDHNTFSIKTKRKKRTDPKHKVVVVDNKKFKKLKRQASDLQKQINEGERLKTLIEIEQAKNLTQSRLRSRSREQEIQAIYMRPLPQRKDKN